MNALQDGLQEVKPPETPQVIAKPTGRKHQVKLFVVGVLVAIAVFMALASRFMKSPRHPDPASLGMAGVGTAPLASAFRSAPPPGALGAPLPKSRALAGPQLGQEPVTSQAQALLPSASESNAAMPSENAPPVPRQIVPNASQSACNTAPAQSRAQEPARGLGARKPVAAASTEVLEAVAKGPAQDSAGKEPYAAAKAAPKHHAVAKRRTSRRNAVMHREAQYDRIGISEE